VPAQQRGELRGLVGAEWPGGEWFVVVGVACVFESLAREPAASSVARQDVQVHVAVHVLQERVVEVVGRERRLQGAGGQRDASAQVRPRLRARGGYVFLVAAQRQEALAQEVLVALVEHQPPVRGFGQDRTEAGIAQNTPFHRTPLSRLARAVATHREYGSARRGGSRRLPPAPVSLGQEDATARAGDYTRDGHDVAGVCVSGWLFCHAHPSYPGRPC